MHRLRPVRRRVPRGRHRHGRRQGAPGARRLLRRAGRLPAGLPHRRHLLRRAGSRSLRRGCRGGTPGRPQRRRDGWQRSGRGRAPQRLSRLGRPHPHRRRSEAGAVACAPGRMPRFPQPLPERRLGTGPHAGRPRRCSGRCRRHRRAFRRGRRSAEPLGSVAVPDQARTGAGPLLPGPRAAYRTSAS